MKGEIDMSDVMSHVTMHVTVIQRPSFRFRFWLGRKILILAVKVMGCRVEFHNISEGLNDESYTP